MQQFGLSLSRTEQHWDVVNSRSTKKLIVWTPGQKKAWHAVGADQARAVLSSLNGEANVYITPNEFYKWRLVRQLARLDSLYVDIDSRSGVDPAAIVENAMIVICRAQLPPPNYIVYSGRGAHLYWLFEPVTGKALPRWQACQSVLQRVLKSDPASVDCTRVLRVVGSLNPKAEKGRQSVMGEQLSCDVYNFDWLADQILPIQRAVVRDIRVRQSTKERPGASRKGGRGVSIYQWWHRVYEDLIRIIEFHWFGGVPEGHRDTLLFLLAVALSWFTHGDALINEISATARHLIPSLSVKEVESYSSSVVDRAKRSTNGERVIWQGKERDPRYWFKRETLFKWLCHLIPPELINELRAIVPTEVITERRRERELLRDRVDEGRYKAKRASVEVRLKALEMRARGTSIRDIATALAVGKSTVADWLRSPNTSSTTDGSALCT